MSIKKVFLLNQNTPVNIPSGLVPKGAYAAGTDYAVGDSVDYNGSSYVMFVDAAAGTLPTDTTKWQVLANKGNTGAAGADGATGPQGPAGTSGHTIEDEGTPLTARTNLNFAGSGVTATDDAGNDATKITITSGGGSGDVVAPATNTDSYIPQWNGANSKTLKDGLAVPAGGLAGLTALGDKVDKVAGSRLITTAEGTILGNTSGTNSGDNAANTSIAATKLDAFATPDNNTNLNANTTNHGLLLQATAPAAGLVNVVGIANGETVYANKALFDATVPSTQAYGDAAATGSAVVSARRDHKHAMMSAPTTEGTAVLSTGESGGTKFLREDGDGTCSWQTPSGGGGGDFLVMQVFS